MSFGERMVWERVMLFGIDICCRRQHLPDPAAACGTSRTRAAAAPVAAPSFYIVGMVSRSPPRPHYRSSGRGIDFFRISLEAPRKNWSHRVFWPVKRLITASTSCFCGAGATTGSPLAMLGEHTRGFSFSDSASVSSANFDTSSWLISLL